VREAAAASRHIHVVITDLHDWDGANPYHEPFALAADLVFLSTAAPADPEATMRRIAERGRARAVMATAGAARAHLLAGDAFAAAFLPPRLAARRG
jgi:uncharacterized membrane protein